MNRSKFYKAVAAAVFGLTAISGAQAAVINFDGITPDLFTGGASFTESGYTMTVLDGVAGGGLSGATVNGADSLACSIIACPGGNSSTYYAGLNDGAINFARTDALGFRVNSLDFSFIAPVGGMIDFSVGRLVLTGKGMNDVVIQTSAEFGTQTNGQFLFSNWSVNGAFGNTVLKDFTVQACLYAQDGSCVNPAMNQAQFALDNVNVAAVPEPSTYMMMGLGLAGLAFAARRRKQA